MLISLISVNFINPVQALFGGGPDIPSTGEIIDEVERHYGFDGNILRRSSKKADYPEVEIFFNNNSPQNGEKVTATALPKFFKNTNDDLYYTWFLFREDDDMEDAEIMEKAKQRAMGLVARGDFDPYLFATDYSGGSDDPDKDGYEASYGGGDGRGGKEMNETFLDDLTYDDFEANHYVNPTSKQLVNTEAITRCYRHNFGVSAPDEYDDIQNVGGDLIVACEHKFPEAPEGETFKNPINLDEELECKEVYEVGDGEFTTNEELCWQLDPNNYDTDGDGYPDEADLAGLGQSQLTWTFKEGDRVGVVVEGTSMIAINESTGVSQTSLNPKILYNCGRVTDDVNYCVNSDGEVGRCGDEVCNIQTCADPAEDLDEPCVTSDGGIGTCVSSGFGVDCEAVKDCTDPDSSNGALCEEEGIAGICLNSDCVLSRCGEEGEPCQTDLGNLGYCDDGGYCQEDTVGVDDPSMNPYYKIMWAGIDVCDMEKVENKDKEDLIENDECENENDYGFTYLATKKVSENSASLLKTTLNFSPEKPQANKSNFDYSDHITVKANFIESGIEDDFVYYEWDVYQCTEDQIINDTCSSDGEKLTDNCGGDYLGDCNALESNSLRLGMGEKQIKFRGSESLYDDDFFEDDDKMYFKVYLKTKETESSLQNYISSINIPINRNALDISFYQINFNGDEISSAFSDEICDEGEYQTICPVYTNQFLVAAYNDTEDKIDSAYWELNDEKINFPNPNPFDNVLTFSELGDYYTYFRVTGSDMNLDKVSFKALDENGETITSERIISTEEPMIKNINPNNDQVWNQVFIDEDGENVNSETVLWGKIGEEISLKAETVPNYLEGNLNENNLGIKWYLNNQEIDDQFIADNSEYAISFPNQEDQQILNFTLNGTEGESLTLKAEIIKDFSEEEKDFLEENWGIKSFKKLEHSKSVIIKQTQQDSPGDEIASGGSLNLFMASTYQNAPEYFVFIIKTAIILVLFWSLFYGFNQWNSREYKLEE